MIDSLYIPHRMLAITRYAERLVWQDLGGVYIVFQPSSTETHVFNGTTAWILHSLEKGAATLDCLVNRLVESLGIEPGEMDASSLDFAVARLETLGLIYWTDDGAALNP